MRKTSTKLFICPECNQSFTGKDRDGFPTARFPLLLSCAHVLCTSCIKASAKRHKQITCPKCKKVTDLSNGEASVDVLPPDYYVIGTLPNLRSVCMPKNFVVRFLPAGIAAAKEQSSPNFIVGCDNCDGNAKWRCDNCVANLCEKCFQNTHNKANKMFKKHHCARLDQQSYRRTVQLGCQDHGQRAIEFFCEDDNQLACGHCAVTGKHVGHRIVTLLSKNESCVEELFKAEEEAKKMKARLKDTLKKVSAVLSKTKPNTANCEQEIRECFHHLICCLQIREAELLNALSDVGDPRSPLENMCQQLEKNVQDLSCLLTDSITARNNGYPPMNNVELIEKLRLSTTLPCHLVTTGVPTDECNVTFDWDSEMKEKILNVGKVEADTNICYSLLPEKDLPADYCVANADNESITTDGDTLSFNGSSHGEPLSPAAIPETVASKPPKIVVKPKHATSLSQELVQISHIKNPSEFWVQRNADLLKLRFLEKNINRWCGNSDNDQFIPSNLEIGSLYLVQYATDQNWYRARLKTVIGDLDSVADEEKPELCEQLLKNGKSVDLDGEDVSNSDVNADKDIASNVLAQNASIDGGNTDILVTEEDVTATAECFVTTGTPPLELNMGGSWADRVQDSDEAGKTFNDSAPSSSSDCYVTVHYVDYGNVESVSVSRLRTMQTQFLKLPCLALQCCLWEIEPIDGKWLQNSVEMFAKLASCSDALMRVVDERNNILYVDLCKPPSSDIQNDYPVSVREALVFLELAIFPNPQNVHPGVNLRRHRRQSFLPPEHLYSGLNINVLVSHVNDPSDFYVQQVAVGAHLSNMSSELQDFYQNESRLKTLTVFVPTIGMACVAQFSLDGRWYRARVIDFPGGGMVEVFYIDFGNKEIVSCLQLAKIIDRFIRLPAQAIHCSLADVVPWDRSGWTEESADWFKQATKKIGIVMAVHECLPKEKAIVSLFEETGLSVRCINGLLVVERYAHSTGPRSSFTEEKRIISVDPKDGSSAQCDVAKQPGVKVKKKHNYTAVTVTHCEDPTCFYVLTAEKDKEPLERLMKQLKEAYENTEPIEKEWLEKEYCAVLDPTDDQWYRGRIVSASDDFVDVTMVDYGRTERLPVTDLRVLEQEFMIEEIFAVRCHLNGLKPAGDSSNWSKSACELFIALCCDMTLYIQIIKTVPENESYAVNLFIKKVNPGTAVDPATITYESIYDKLIDSGLAIPTQRFSRNSKAAVIEEETLGLDKQTMVPRFANGLGPALRLLPSDPDMKWLPLVPLEETEFDVVPTFIGYEGFVYFHPYQKVENQLKSMSETLGNIFNSMEKKFPVVTLPQVGQICITRFTLDKKWYRGEITEVLSAVQQLKVLFIDYGNIQIVNFEDIRMHVAFLDVPKLCYAASLHDAIPVSLNGDWPESTLTLVSDLTVEKICHIHIEKRDKCGLEISLELPGKVSLVNFLRTQGLITIPEQPEVLPTSELVPVSLEEVIKGEVKEMPFTRLFSLPTNTFVPVLITHMFETNVVCMQLLPFDSPATPLEIQINEEHNNFLLMNDTLDEKGAQFPPLRDPKPGMACCGLYTFDDRWYRCLILDVLDDNSVSVLYVDYGNSETLPLERVHELANECLRFPMQGQICQLHGLRPTDDSGWSKESLSSMSALFFHEMSTTQSFQAEIMSRAPPLQVRLFEVDPETNDKSLAYKKLIMDRIVLCD